MGLATAMGLAASAWVMGKSAKGWALFSVDGNLSRDRVSESLIKGGDQSRRGKPDAPR